MAIQRRAGVAPGRDHPELPVAHLVGDPLADDHSGLLAVAPEVGREVQQIASGRNAEQVPAVGLEEDLAGAVARGVRHDQRTVDPGVVVEREEITQHDGEARGHGAGRAVGQQALGRGQDQIVAAVAVHVRDGRLAHQRHVDGQAVVQFHDISRAVDLPGAHVPARVEYVQLHRVGQRYDRRPYGRLQRRTGEREDRVCCRLAVGESDEHPAGFGDDRRPVIHHRNAVVHRIGHHQLPRRGEDRVVAREIRIDDQIAESEQ